jgi:uncharacterized protein YyaL (SSP411 family)
MPPEGSNALAKETSPYLLQHADNPVRWYPWSATALKKARDEDKPILLSVGYSACHWCHVMAHESFEDPDTARIMNEHFVNIKVDREERPDLDKIYQTAHQLLTQRPGGWPLTMFLTPDDHTPFFGGTYFPKERRYGMRSFKEILEWVAEVHRQRKTDIAKQNASLLEAMLSTEPEPGGGDISREPLDDAVKSLKAAYDQRFGGFGGAPKFPHPTNIERLLRHFAATAAADEADTEASQLAGNSLLMMAHGGIYDHLGGGFCRYSVDQFWMIPHFEKMLYDNGPLLTLYSEAWQLSGEPVFEQTARETAAWVMREMQSPEGGYYATLDADSEGKEGKFYVWTPDEVKALLNDDEYTAFAARYGLDGDPNFEGEAWHLHTFKDWPKVAKAAGVDEAKARALVAGAKPKLFETRSQRVWPGRDEKILTSWNALMIKGMATAARVFGDDDFLSSAERALAFVRSELWQDGRLRVTYKDGEAKYSAYLDDHAFLLDALLCLLQCRWRSEDLSFSIELADLMLARFEDKADGGFFFTADDSEKLFHRTKPMIDDALPAGNGIAACALGRLGHLLGETRYLDAAANTLRAGWQSLSRVPHAHNALLLALEEHLDPPQTVVLRGEGKELERWQERCLSAYAPRRLSVAIPSAENSLPGMLKDRVAKDGVTAYVCEGHVCQAPVKKFEDLDAALAPLETHVRVETAE